MHQCHPRTRGGGHGKSGLVLPELILQSECSSRQDSKRRILSVVSEQALIGTIVALEWQRAHFNALHFPYMGLITAANVVLESGARARLLQFIASVSWTADRA